MADAMEGVITQEQVNTEADVLPSIKFNFSLLERAVTQFDSRFTLRALRSISSLRKHLTADILSQVVATTYPTGNETAAILLKAIGLDQRKAQEVMKTGEKYVVSKEPIPEVDIYLGILVQVFLYDQKNYKLGASFSGALVDQIRLLNRRTLDCT